MLAQCLLLNDFKMTTCNVSTGAGTRDAAVEAVQHLPDLAAVALAHVVDYLRSFQSEGVLQQVSCGQPAGRVQPCGCVHIVAPAFVHPLSVWCSSTELGVVNGGNGGMAFNMLLCTCAQCAAFRPFQDARCMALSPNALRQLEVGCAASCYWACSSLAISIFALCIDGLRSHAPHPWHRTNCYM